MGQIINLPEGSGSGFLILLFVSETGTLDYLHSSLSSSFSFLLLLLYHKSAAKSSEYRDSWHFTMRFWAEFFVPLSVDRLPVLPAASGTPAVRCCARPPGFWAIENASFPTVYTGGRIHPPPNRVLSTG